MPDRIKTTLERTLDHAKTDLGRGVWRALGAVQGIRCASQGSTLTIRPRTREVYEYICDHIVEWQRPPTFRGICAAFGWTSTNAAAEHLEALVNAGMIERHQGEWRGIHVTGRQLMWAPLTLAETMEMCDA